MSLANDALARGAQLTPRILAAPPLSLPPELRTAGKPRAIGEDVLAGVLPGPGRDRLASGPVLAVTTGQQPGLFSGPLYTIYKALSAIAVARRLERAWGTPVVPVFWVAGDDHDFAEANHVWVLNTAGDAVRIMLRERPPDDVLRPLWREPCGAEVTVALSQLRDVTPQTEFKDEVLHWLEHAYQPDTSLADAFAHALNALLGPRGLAVFRAYAPSPKRAMSPLLLRALKVTLEDGYSPVLMEGAAGRDRLRPVAGAFETRRGGERFSVAALERVAAEAPERLSPNVLLRPAIEAVLLPTVAYAAGPAELEYLPAAHALYAVVGDGVEPQAAVPRWSATLVEARVAKVLERYEVDVEAFAGPPGTLESRLVRDALPPNVVDAIAELRDQLTARYGSLAGVVAQVDPTLERTVESARNAALGGTRDIEKKLIAAVKRANETLIGQIERARAALFPGGRPQERALTLASFLIRYGPALLDALDGEVARWADLS